MKRLVVVLLAVLSAASSLTAASDTLRVISYRTIDLCNSERRWLISAYMGEIFAGDSLQSFDITLGYDTSRIVPTDGLIQGTLSEQMKFSDVSPFFNFIVPGEIRVGAFTITRNVKGDLPLFAVAGTYKGGCNDWDTFTLPWVPEFNGEFKGSVITFVSDTIITTAAPRVDTSQGASIIEDTVTINGLDSVGQFATRLYADKLVGQSIVETISIDQRLFTIDSVMASGSDSNQINATGDTLRIYRTILSADDASSTVWLTSRSSATDTTCIVRITTASLTECGCITPAKADTLVLRSQQPTSTIIEWDVHESSDLRIWNRAGLLEFQCSHGQPWTVTLTDLQGNMTRQIHVNALSTQQLSLDALPKGLYMITASNGERVQTTKVLN